MQVNYNYTCIRTVGRDLQLSLRLHSFSCHEYSPWPSKVPLPIMDKPRMSSNNTHSSEFMSEASVGAFKLPLSRNVVEPLHGPANVTVFNKNVPCGIKTTPFSVAHACFHAFSNA